MKAPAVELEIAAIGARGDGIARHGGTSVYLPFTAPGDRVLARLGAPRGDGIAGTVERILKPGPGRAAPACRHFGACGGCTLQHLDAIRYAAAEMDLLRAALARHGLGEAPLEPLFIVPPGARRRVRFAIAWPRGRTAPVLGLAERGTHALVDLAECPVLDPRLFALAAPLRALAHRLLRPGEHAHAGLQDPGSGIDLLLDLPRAPDLPALEALAEFAAAQDLARIQWRGEGGAIVPVAQRRPVQAMLGGIAVDVPPDAFLQATAAGEAALVAEAVAGIGDAPRIADLFAGIGTFTFALAGRAKVHAVEGWTPAVAALLASARRSGLAQRVTAEARDLEARPLAGDELRRYDAVIFDPPRAGAKHQAAALAASGVPRILAVSCNPATFARDARLLVEGGYRLLRMQPVDQFLWSAHLELAALFAR
jgi:23S rRNA (uracil1939-C5)-methyltransferase